MAARAESSPTPVAVADEPDVGYMGFVRLLCSGLQKLSSSKPEVAAALSKISGWSDVIVRDLEDMERVYKEHLGGAPPDAGVSPTGGFDCLEAIRRTADGAGDDGALTAAASEPARGAARRPAASAR